MSSTREFRLLAIACLLIALLFRFSHACRSAKADDAPTASGTKLLFDPTAPGADKLITPSSDDVSATVASDGITLTLPANVGYPGILIKPSSGPSWDLSAFGHLEAKVTNLGDKKARLEVSVEADSGNPPSSADKISLAPGESQTVKVVLGAYYGSYSRKFHSDAVKQLRFFAVKGDDVRKFRVEQIQAAGVAGEKPVIVPMKSTIVPRPANGVIFDAGTKLKDPKQLVSSKTGGQISLAADGTALNIEFTGDKQQSVTLKGAWSLADCLQVSVKLKNVGKTAVTPGVRIDDRNGNSTETITPSAPLRPGEETEITVPFQAKTVWKGLEVPAQLVADGPKQNWDKTGQPGGGTYYRSNLTTGITIISDATPGPKQLQVTSIIGGMPATVLPDWLGKKPPVDGDWVQTFDDDFDGTAVDLKKWDIYGDNYWGPLTHFSKDNTFVKDGKLILRLEKKEGTQNDDPNGKDTEYATGYAATYGKWVQRYGYFEARMKLPTNPNHSLAFWMMPDRGLKAGPQWKRSSTGKLPGETAGGMEFDIMETLTIWCPYRHDAGMHWDGYAKHHKSLGEYCMYVPPDKDGFITVGMLWTPGHVSIYDNGKETESWDSPRVSDVQSYLMFDLVDGGWETEPMDDAKLPSDFVIDYVHAWQRKDLASDVDGPIPNDGGPFAPEK